MLRRATLLVGVVLLSLAASAPAHGAEPGASELQTARELFAAAEKDEREGSWALALEKLRRVGEIKMTPGIRVHIATCEERLGLLVAALGDYALADAQAVAENNQDVKHLMKEPLEALQARVPRVLIRVPPDVKGATVSLDGKPLVHGVLGMAMPVDASEHHIEASAPGFLVFRTTFVAKDRERAEVVVRLEPVVVATSALEGRGPNRTPAVVAAAGALLLTGAGVGAYLVAEGKQSDARETCARSASCDGERSAVRTWDALALSAWIGAGAAAAVAVVLWTTSGDRGRAAANLVIGPRRLSVEGSF